MVLLLLFALTHALQFNEWPFDIGAMTNVRVMMTDSPVKEEGGGGGRRTDGRTKRGVRANVIRDLEIRLGRDE